MAVGFSNINKPLNPRGQDASPKGYNRASLFSGKALDFYGVNDKVFLSDFVLTGNTASISFYLNWDDYGTDTVQFICEGDTYNDLMIHIGGGSGIDGFRFSMTSGAAFDSTGVIQKGYNFYTLTTDGTTANVYVNGVLFNSEQVNLGSVNITELGIGNRQLNNTLFFDGQIAGFKIFNTALTAAQVADLYNNPEKVVPTGLESNLKLWLPMMEGAGTTAYDGSGNGNHGTIAGATYVNGIGAPVAQSAVIDWNKGSNLLTYSEDFTQWTGNGLSSTIADDTTAPNGLLKADKIIENTSTNFHRWFQQIVAGSESGSNQSYTISGFVKYIDRQYISIGLSDNAAYNGLVNFDLINGTIGGEYTYNGSTFSNKTITDVGNDWWKFSVTITSPTWSGGSVYAIGFFQESSSVSTGFYIGQSKSVHVWGWNAAKENYITSYIPTIATAQTTPVLLPQGLTTGRDITGVNLFENVRKQGALNLDGNSWAEVHDNASIDLSDANASFEAWVYHIDNGVVSQYIMNKFDGTTGVRMRTETGNNFGFYASDGTNNIADSGTFPLTANAWNHIVLTTDGANFKRYIDGALVDTDVAGTALTTFANADSLYIGSEQTNASLAQSRIAQPRIYNRALTASEVLRNYNSGKNTYTND
jgi:hypothetical protein